MDDRPKVLVLDGRVSQVQTAADALDGHFDVVHVSGMDDALEQLRHGTYYAVLSDIGGFLPLERGLVGEKASLVLNTIGEGVCIVDADGRMAWSNQKARGFTPAVTEKIKTIASQARAIFQNQVDRTTDNITPHSKKFTFQVDERHYELMSSPVIDHNTDDQTVQQVVAVVWDTTSGRRLQQKVDAIDASGRELGRIESDLVQKLTPAERLKLLQEKIIKYSKDLMHFDHFAIRLLDKASGKLEVVISEGLPPEALEIDLYNQPEGNGISGYVAATGRSYICHDVEKDPRYVLGLQHCKSSLTVPLMLFDKVIGVYNVESISVGAFNEDDRQFAEIFGRYVAMALNILDLLVVERCATSGMITDNVLQEMAQPLNDIVTEAQSLMEEYIGDDAMRERLNHIVNNVETVRASIRDVAAGPQHVIGSAEHQTPVDPVLNGKRVLIADDETNIRETIGDILTKHGCAVEVCKDGYEACNVLEQDKFDLVLSDIKMPYRNGYEIFAAARRRDDHVPVLLMTGFGYDPHHSIVRASQEGLASVLFKPFKVDQLLEEVYKALGAEAPATAGEPAE